MKKLKFLFIIIPFILFSSCSKPEESVDIVSTLLSSGSKPEETANIVNRVPSCNETEEPVGDPKYYDQDENCDIPKLENSTCCDVDGRILVTLGKSYTYTYKTREKLSSKPIIWTITTGDIKIVNGQGTDTATFCFGENFTTGSIQCTGFSGIYEDLCQDTIYMAKL